jgi:hypothetical protein
MPESEGWYLKKETGDLYGPVSAEELAAWARDGRVAPGDFLSETRADWRPAHTLPALTMEWFVESAPDSFYGPAHAEAFCGMLREGALAGTARVRHAKTGEETTLSLLAARIEGRALRPAPSSPSAAPPAAPAAESPERTVSWQTMAREKDRFEREAAKWKGLYEEERARAVAAERARDEAVRTLEQERISHHTALEQAAREVQALHQVETLRAGADGGEAGLEAAYAGLSRSFDAVSAELEQKNAELRELREQVGEARKRFDEERDRLREDIRTECAAADSARTRLAQVEQAQEDLVHALRDLNDRYIRLREKISAPASAEAPASAAVPSPATGGRIRLTR